MKKIFFSKLRTILILSCILEACSISFQINAAARRRPKPLKQFTTYQTKVHRALLPILPDQMKNLLPIIIGYGPLFRVDVHPSVEAEIRRLEKNRCLDVRSKVYDKGNMRTFFIAGFEGSRLSHLTVRLLHNCTAQNKIHKECNESSCASFLRYSFTRNDLVVTANHPLGKREWGIPDAVGEQPHIVHTGITDIITTEPVPALHYIRTVFKKFSKPTADQLNIIEKTDNTVFEVREPTDSERATFGIQTPVDAAAS